MCTCTHMMCTCTHMMCTCTHMMCTSYTCTHMGYVFQKSAWCTVKRIPPPNANDGPLTWGTFCDLQIDKIIFQSSIFNRYSLKKNECYKNCAQQLHTYTWRCTHMHTHTQQTDRWCSNSQGLPKTVYKGPLCGCRQQNLHLVMSCETDSCMTA